MPVLLVTGATGGVAQAVIRQALPEWSVVAVSRQALPPDFAGAEWITADVSNAAALGETLMRVQPDAVVHAVGSTQIAPFATVTADRFEEQWRINVLSAYHVLHAFIRQLRQRQAPGAAVLFSSVVSRIGVTHHEAIASAKAGVEGLALSAAASHAAQNIRVNVVAPGLTETPMTARMLSSEAGRTAAIKQYPLSGINAADDVAATALWLVSPAASRITGQVVAVDGGFSHIRPMVR